MEGKQTAWSRFTVLGPGLAIAATGVGAGDMVAASVAGSRFGLTVAWAAVAGALLKYVLNEGVARWQLATGSSLLEGWVRHLGGWVRYLFLAYLVVWSFVVGGALISACGMAAHALAPVLSVRAWGVLHSMAAAVLVILGGYGWFEKIMKWMIGAMFLALIGCAAWVAEPGVPIRLATSAGIPQGGVWSVLGVMGGVGGSVTLLSYGYWMKERGWTGPARLGIVRLDLAVAYVLTGLFGVAVVVLSAATLHTAGVEIAGNQAVLRMAGLLTGTLGRAGYWLFLFGFWAAVWTSMLGVWQGVPYLFDAFIASVRGRKAGGSRSPGYRGFLAWLAVPPMLLLFMDRPVGVVMAYSVLGALFMPFLATTLLVLNSRRDLVGEELRNRWPAVLGLAGCVVLFVVLAVVKLGGPAILLSR